MTRAVTQWFVAFCCNVIPGIQLKINFKASKKYFLMMLLYWSVLTWDVVYKDAADIPRQDDAFMPPWHVAWFVRNDLCLQDGVLEKVPVMIEVLI